MLVVEAQGDIDTAQQGLLEQGHIQLQLVVEAQGDILTTIQQQVEAAVIVHFMAIHQLAAAVEQQPKTGEQRQEVAALEAVQAWILVQT